MGDVVDLSAIARPDDSPHASEPFPTVPPVDESPPPPPMILVVDDSAYTLRALAAQFRGEFRIETASDGQIGLDKAKALKPDLIITDIMMPNMDGESLVREVRRCPDLDATPIVVFTGQIDDELEARLLGLGVQEFCLKSFSPYEILARTRSLIAYKRAGDILRKETGHGTNDVEALASTLVRDKLAISEAFRAMCAACEKVNQESHAKTAFLGLVSHELLTPLQTIRLSADLLRRGPEMLSPIQSQSVERISRATARLTAMFESLLEFVRIESGKLEVRNQEVSLHAIAEAVVTDLAPLAERKRLALRVRPTGEMPPAVTDPRLVRVILDNLVDNAIKYTDEGHVLVVVEQVGRDFLIHVEDTGPGVPPDQQSSIFESFKQIEKLGEKHAPGVGLGLTLARRLAESLRGSVTMMNGKERGSIFTLALPGA